MLEYEVVILVEIHRDRWIPTELLNDFVWFRLTKSKLRKKRNRKAPYVDIHTVASWMEYNPQGFVERVYAYDASDDDDSGLTPS